MVSTAFNIVFSACVHCQFVAWNIKAEKEKKKGKKQWSRAYCNFTGLDRQKMEFKLQRNQDLRSKILRKKEPQGGEADMKPEFTQVIL